GDVAHVELVEGEEAELPRDVARDRVERILLPGQRAHALVDLAHELVEVHAALAAMARHLVEGVHHQRLAAPDAAPDVDAARRLLSRAEVRHQAVDLPGAILPVLLELLEEAFEVLEHLQLLAIGLKIVPLAEVPVPLERAGEIAGVLLGLDGSVERDRWLRRAHGRYAIAARMRSAVS